MRMKGILVTLLALGSLQTVVAQSSYDTLWLCKNEEGTDLWTEMGLADTFPDNRGKFEMTDTGDSQDGSAYINFDYQFTDSNPGYAGFKCFWDYGIMQFYAEGHDSMVLWHKGPLPEHKVKLVWAQGSAGCGTPINYEDYAEFKSSAEWKREAFGFPEGFVKNGLFELRFLIYNDPDAGGVSPTSEPGCLKVDNMFFKKASDIAVTNPMKARALNNARYFVPTVSDKVTLTVFSLQGEQLFRQQVNVDKGKRYNVTRFARTNSNLPDKWIQCVQITGAGVNVTRKIFH